MQQDLVAQFPPKHIGTSSYSCKRQKSEVLFEGQLGELLQTLCSERPLGTMTHEQQDQQIPHPSQLTCLKPGTKEVGLDILDLLLQQLLPFGPGGVSATRVLVVFIDPPAILAVPRRVSGLCSSLYSIIVEYCRPSIIAI